MIPLIRRTFLYVHIKTKEEAAKTTLFGNFPRYLCYRLYYSPKIRSTRLDSAIAPGKSRSKLIAWSWRKARWASRLHIVHTRSHFLTSRGGRYENTVAHASSILCWTLKKVGGAYSIIELIAVNSTIEVKTSAEILENVLRAAVLIKAVKKCRNFESVGGLIPKNDGVLFYDGGKLLENVNFPWN